MSGYERRKGAPIEDVRSEGRGGLAQIRTMGKVGLKNHQIFADVLCGRPKTEMS